MGKQSEAIEVPKISCQQRVEVDQTLLRTMEQYLDKEHEPASRFFERRRESPEKEIAVREMKEKEHLRRVLLS